MTTSITDKFGRVRGRPVRADTESTTRTSCVRVAGAVDSGKTSTFSHVWGEVLTENGQRTKTKTKLDGSRYGKAPSTSTCTAYAEEYEEGYP